MKKIGIIGAGAWGTALAQNLSSLGRDVTLWVREAETLSAINQKHENVPSFPESSSMKISSQQIAFI